MQLRYMLGLDDCFHYLGDVISTAPLYQLASVICLLSHTEGLPNVVLEAMSAGRPVVATNVGGTGELVVDGDTGFLVDAGDVKMAANRICALLVSDRLAGEMSTAALRRVKQHFSLHRMITQLEGVYESALRGD
jgi:glycosyltransferase involved in cell wall biosynthesis